MLLGSSWGTVETMRMLCQRLVPPHRFRQHHSCVGSWLLKREGVAELVSLRLDLIFMKPQLEIARMFWVLYFLKRYLYGCLGTRLVFDSRFSMEIQDPLTCLISENLRCKQLQPILPQWRSLLHPHSLRCQMDQMEPELQLHLMEPDRLAGHWLCALWHWEAIYPITEGGL